MKVLAIQSSASMDWSLTRKLSNAFLERLIKSEPGIEIIHRDLVKDPPPFVNPDWISGAFSKIQLSVAQKKALETSDLYIQEVSEADIIIMATPMYNYGMPASLKAWFDQIARVNKTFSFDLSRGDFPIEPILSGRKLVALTSSGEFGFEKGGAREEMNHLVPHIRSCAHYLGVDTKKDFFHIGIEYQEFKDDRHDESTAKAFASIDTVARNLLNARAASRQHPR